MAQSSTRLYGLEFFELQLAFAAKAAALSGLSLSDAVGSHTNFYVRLAMGARLDRTNPDWNRYVSALACCPDPLSLTYQLYQERVHIPTGAQVFASVGCFALALAGEDRARLHFVPGSSITESPLSQSFRAQRRHELGALLLKTVSSHPRMQIVGASWLYNLPAYSGIFPRRYVDRLRTIEPLFQRMPLWGQFLRRDGTVRAEAAREFKDRLAACNDANHLGCCFPLQVLSATASAAELLEQLSE